ncbi:MAG: YfhO family protein [Ferruginibacter sp.]
MLRKIITNPFFVFPIITCLVFWPFTLQLFSLKNDALTYYYPVRTLISDALNNGELPLWTPFINMGYPLHADMQAGAWNPVIWIFSFLTNYSLAAFHYELLFYISFAGTGFYFLCKEFGCSRPVAFTMGIAYQFSGFMIDSVQFFTCISAACYIPFVFIFFRRMLLKQQMKDALLSAFFLFLLFTGGYPSLFIILSYSLFAYAAFIFFSTHNKKIFLKKVLPVTGIVCLFFILLTLPAILSFIRHLPEIERGKSQSLAVVLENSMNPTSMLSLLTPFGTTANDSWLHSSILMRSIYIGIIPLLFLLYACFSKSLRKNKELIFFFVCALIMLGMAWGEFFFLRQLAYYTLPLMNSFRHPALFRLFAIFFFLLITAISFNAWDMSSQKNIELPKRILFSLTAITIIIGIVSLIFLNDFSSIHGFNSSVIKDLLLKLDFGGRYLIQFPFLTVIILLSYWAIVKKKNIRLACFIIMADMFFATQLNMPITVYGAKNFTTIEQLINRNRVKFPLPDDNSIEQNSLNSFDENFVAGSRLPFTKKIGRNDYFITPGNLLKQDEFYESPIKDSIFKNPLLYYEDSKTARIEINKFSANELHAVVSKKTAGILVYLQNDYHGWQAFVDGKPTRITTVHTCFMSIEVPAGDHEIIFRYRPQTIINAWYVSVFSFVLLVVIYLFLFFSRQRSMKHQRESE